MSCSSPRFGARMLSMFCLTASLFPHTFLIAIALFTAADFHGKVCNRGGGGYAVAYLYADYDRKENVFHL